MKKSGSIVIFGATSGIARAVSRELAKRGDVLVLVGRDEAALRAEAADLAARFGRESRVFVWDLLERELHGRRFADLIAGEAPFGALGGVFFASGVMPTEAEAEASPAATRLNFDVNLTEPVVVLNLFAGYFRAQGSGFLSVLSSVAGDRGRAGNKTYGASKAGLSAWLEGLRASLHGTGVLVQTVKPGPTRTPLTAGYKGPAVLVAAPETIARAVVRGLERGRTTVYAPPYWRFVMGLIRLLPESLARKVPG
ncbi:MAG: short-chain dehydrogenase [Fibrobacteria bacterium]|jgi:short-subunit dehydrogenase|nr:short-chain dehydrogenase [Fibrobacteria bacterium]